MYHGLFEVSLCNECKGTGIGVSQWINRNKIPKGGIGYLPRAVNDYCNQKSPENMYYCTREKGHSGYHAGHESGAQQVGVWD
jgi:hypothetical protein